ncbi:ABC transporter permease subunit, partial [Glutamicibacter protophormiae]
MTTTVPSKSAISVLPSKKTPIIFSVLAVIVLVSFGLLGNSQTASFSLSSAGDAFSLPDLVFPGRASNIVIGVLLAALAAYSWMLRSKGRVLPVWSVAVGAVLFVLAFLIWVVSGANINSISLASLLAGGVVLAVPLVFGSLSGVLSERSGVVNIAIEGQLLGGAFTAAIVASVTQNAFAGLIAAGLAGAVVSLVLALFSIKYLVNQIIVGVVLNVLVSGITGFLFTTVMQEDPQLYNSPVHLPTIAIPGLS